MTFEIQFAHGVDFVEAGFDGVSASGLPMTTTRA